MNNIVVVGQGAAGLSAALAAAEAARAKRIAAQITLIDKAPEADAGGNTRWTPSYMRMASVDRVEPSFVHDMLEATKFRGDEGYFATLAQHAPATACRSTSRSIIWPKARRASSPWVAARPFIASSPAPHETRV